MEKTNFQILIVDDEPLILEAISVLLEQDDIVTTRANNGLEGLEALEKNQDFQCIVSDIRMPKMDGVAFIQEVRKLNERVPFIFFTAFGDKRLMQEAVKYGAFDFIAKPNFEDLIPAIKRALHLKQNDHDNNVGVANEYIKMLGKKL